MFLKFDVFGELRVFGYLSSELVEVEREEEEFMGSFKRELEDRL